MGLSEIFALIMNIIGWIIGTSKDKSKKAKEALEDVVYEMKKKSEAVKIHKESVGQSLRAKLRRQDLLKKYGKKDGMKAPKTKAPKDLRPKWYIVAEKELGVSESVIGSNKRIEEYHASTESGANSDDVPWCASFVTWCLEKAGYVSTDSPLARSYLKYGKKLNKPKLGCIVVFRRGRSSWKGHVGFYVGETKQFIKVLGGNQSDKVSVAKYKKKNLLGYRWPV